MYIYDYTSLNSSFVQSEHAPANRMKTIIDDKELDEIVIVVNGRSITRRDIESAKVYVEFNFGEDSLKNRINNLIIDAVLETEAQKLGIKGSQEDVDLYIANEKELGFPPLIVGYIKGMELTAEEYYKILEDMMYISTVRNNVWLKYREEQADKMKNEKSTIEIIDPEVMALIGN